MKKPLSDGEVNDHAWRKITGDLDTIEASSMFDEKDPLPEPNAGTKVEAHGVSVHIKPMNGEQVQDKPSFEEKEIEKEGEFGL